MILGDHPACRDGFPVQTSWKHSDRYSVSVDSYEEARSPTRRSGSELYISSFDRLKLIRNIPLRSLGQSASNIRELDSNNPMSLKIRSSPKPSAAVKSSSPMSCPPRIQDEDSKPWRADST